jgi:hypothetical protein
MSRIKLYEQFINEGVSSKAYHFTNTHRLQQILETNSFNLTPVFGTKSDSEINNNKLYAFSLTSSRHSDVGYAQSLPKDRLVRITIDGRKITDNNQSKRVDYWQRPKDPKDPMYNDTFSPKGKSLYKHIARQDELEDRILSDNNTIENADKYITKIEVLNGKTEELENIKYHCNELEISFFAYDTQKYFDASIENKAIEVEAKKHDFDSSERGYSLVDLLALYLYKNEDKVDSTISEISQLRDDFNEEELKASVNKKISDVDYRLRYPDVHNMKDYNNSISSYIHNEKSSTNKATRYIINKIGTDMKKSKVFTLYDYIESKMYKGKKRQVDFNKEYVDKIDKYFNEEYPEYLKRYDSGSYLNTGDYVDSLYTQDDVKEILDSKINQIRKIYTDYAKNNDSMYSDYFSKADTYTVEKLLDLDSMDLESIKNKYNDFYDDEFKRFIKGVIREMDDLSYDYIQSAKDESNEQWRSKK